MLTESKTFPGIQEHLASILSWTYGQVKTFSLPDKELKRVELALEEAIVNILNYAPAEAPLELTITIRNLPTKQLEIELKDNGNPFNPLTHKFDDQSRLPLEERKPGGLGVMLIIRCMDAVTYRFEDGYNILTLTKDTDSSPST